MNHEDTIARLRADLTGQEPPASVVGDIGGWEALGAAARTLIDDPLLPIVTSIVCRDLDPYDSSSVSTANALVDVVAGSRDAMTFASALDAMCHSATFLSVAGSRLAGACLPLAGPPASQDPKVESAEAQRAAEALEALMRLALAGHGSKFKVLGVVTDINAPQPPRYARAVLRTIGAAYDHWEAVEEVAGVVEVVTEKGSAVEGDAEWTAANIEVVRALRAGTALTARDHFRNARVRLATISADRDDARILDQVLAHLDALMDDVAVGEPAVPVAALAFDAGSLAALVHEAGQFALSSAGLGHWAGNRKRVVIGSWVRLAEDLTWLATKMDRDVFYEVAVVVDRIAQIYDASHSYDVTAHSAGVGIVWETVRPAIEGGFVKRATLMRHLSDHADALEEQESTGGDVGSRLAGVRVLLSAARERLLTSSEPPGKGTEQAEVPPLLADLLDGQPDLLQRLGSTLDVEELKKITSAVATYQHISRTEPDLVVDAVIETMVGRLQGSPHFKGEVADAVTRVVRALTLYVASMTNVQRNEVPWLFEASVPESTLHQHLLQWLWSNHFRQRTASEAQSVAGGRVDIQFSFEGFRLVAELKVDTTHVPVKDKPKYIQQAAAYGNTDIKIGFLVLLRTPASGASNLDDLASNITHTTIDGAGGTGDRHVVMFDIPGNRTPPSKQ